MPQPKECPELCTCRALHVHFEQPSLRWYCSHCQRLMGKDFDEKHLGDAPRYLIKTTAGTYTYLHPNHPAICASHRDEPCNCLFSLPLEALPDSVPETPRQKLERKNLSFFLVALTDACAKVQQAAVDVLLNGPYDDGEEALTYWQKLEAAWTALDALNHSLRLHGFPVQMFDENLAVEIEKLRTRYQQSSGSKSLLRLPIFKVGQEPCGC